MFCLPFLAATVVESLEGCDDAELAPEGAETVVLKAVDLLAVVVGLTGAEEVVGREVATVGLKYKKIIMQIIKD